MSANLAASEGSVLMARLLNGTAEPVDELIERVAAEPAQRHRVLRCLLGEPPSRRLGVYPIPEGFKLSVVIPVYNEERWVRELVRRVQAVPIPKELVIVEDCSKDRTREVLKEIEGEYDNVRVFYQDRNRGKG